MKYRHRFMFCKNSTEVDALLKSLIFNDYYDDPVIEIQDSLNGWGVWFTEKIEKEKENG